MSLEDLFDAGAGLDSEPWLWSNVYLCCWRDSSEDLNLILCQPQEPFDGTEHCTWLLTPWWLTSARYQPSFALQTTECLFIGLGELSPATLLYGWIREAEGNFGSAYKLELKFRQDLLK